MTDNYPFYGNIVTDPIGQWPRLREGANAIVDPSLLTSLNARVGDTLRLNFGTFIIIATIKDVPGAAGIAEMLGPRVFIPAKYIAETQLLVFGSIAERTVLAKLPPGQDPDKFIKPLKPRLDAQQVRSRTVTQSEMATADAIENLSNFIGIVATRRAPARWYWRRQRVRAFVARKNRYCGRAAVSGRLEWAVMTSTSSGSGDGAARAAAGAALGVAIQFILSHVLTQILPVDVRVSLVPSAVLTGLAVGGWIALISRFVRVARSKRVSAPDPASRYRR